MASFDQVGVEFWTVISLLLSVLAAMGRADEIRCYCNLSVCVSTGYMCKSTAGVCFSEVSPDGDSGKARHGCLHLLRTSKRQICERRVLDANLVPNSNEAAFPYLSCCSEDMCNYMDCLDIKIHIHTKANHTHSTGGGGSSSSLEEREVLSGNPPAQAANGVASEMTRQDLWFKAAVIAVPIAGGFILIMLILLAVHLLRKDNRRHRQMLELKRLKQLRSRLLLDDEYKHSSYPAYPHLPPQHQTCVYDEQKTAVKTNHNMYKNVNIAFARDNKNFCVMVSNHEKQLIKDNNKYDYNLLLEKPLNTDPASVRVQPFNWAEICADYRHLNHDKRTNNDFKSSTPV